MDDDIKKMMEGQGYSSPGEKEPETKPDASPELKPEDNPKPDGDDKENPVEGQPEAKPDEKPAGEKPNEGSKPSAEEPKPFDFGVYGVKDEEELKAFIDKGRNYDSTVGEYETKLSDFNEKSAYYEELENSVKDIAEKFKNWTSNERFRLAHAAEQIAGSNKDFNAAVRVVSNDLDKMSDIDVLVLQKQLNTPGSEGDADMIKAFLVKRLGVDVKAVEEEKEKPFDLNTDLTPEQKIELKMDAASARTTLNDLKANVQYEELPDPLKNVSDKAKEKQERVEALKTQWATEAKRIAESRALDTIEYFSENEKGEKVLDFSYKIDSDYKNKVINMVVEYAAKKGLDVSPENVDAITKVLVDTYENQNRDLIRKAYARDKVSALEKKYDEEKHNSRPFNPDENPNPNTNPEEGLKDWANKKILGE